MTALELYQFPGSLCSQKVKLVLLEKRLEWETHLVNWLTFENLRPAYIRLNPKAVVPTLVHNGKIICNSAVIIQYLDETFPNPKLTPTEPELRQAMMHWIALQDKFPIRELVYGNLKGIDGLVARRTVQIKQKLIPKLMYENPNLYAQYLAKLEDVKQWNSIIHDPIQITTINQRITLILDRLDQQLSKTKWLCGDTYSLADSVWTVVLSRLEELKFNKLWQNGQRLAISAYLQRLKDRPSFEAAIGNDVMPLGIILPGLRRIFLGF